MTTPSDNHHRPSVSSTQGVTSVEKWMLDQLFDTAHVGIVFTDTQSRVIRANRLVSNAVKFTESGLIKAAWEEQPEAVLLSFPSAHFL